MTGTEQKFNLGIMTESVKTVAEAADRLGVTIVTVKRWAADGQLEPIRETPYLFESTEIERKASELAAEYRAKLAHLEPVAATA